MPNYRYATPEYMRRNNPGHQTFCQAEPACSISNMSIAMAYVPWQEWRSIYEVEKGLCCGTIFEELYKPFCGMGGC